MLLDHVIPRCAGAPEAWGEVCEQSPTSWEGAGLQEPSECPSTPTLLKKKKAIEKHIVPLRVVDCEALLKTMLGGGFILFLPLLGEDDPLLTNIFQMRWNQQLDSLFGNAIQKIVDMDFLGICDFLNLLLSTLVASLGEVNDD